MREHPAIERIKSLRAKGQCELCERPKADGLCADCVVVYERLAKRWEEEWRIHDQHIRKDGNREKGLG